VVAKDNTGDFTTIATALTAATTKGYQGTIFIKPGTYTENLTLVAGVNLSGFQCDTDDVIILGNSTFSGSGTVQMAGITLQTNGAALLTVSGASASLVTLFGCEMIMGNTGISFSSSSSSSQIQILRCKANLTTTGIAFFTHSSAGSLIIKYSSFSNSGNSSTTSTASNGPLSITYSLIVGPITTSNTCGFSSDFCIYETAATNTTSVTHNATTGCTFLQNIISSGTASALSVGVGGTVAVKDCNFNSSNVNNVTGAGVLQYTCIGQGLTPGAINAGTNTGLQENIGILALGTPLGVTSGGTGIATATAYSIITAGTTATGNFQNVAGVGSIGQVLASSGAAALPAWQVAPVIFSVSNIDGKVGAATLIFTTTSNRFTPTDIVFELTTIAGYVSVPSITVGTNGASYNNILGISPLTGVTTQNQLLRFSLTSVISSVATATGVYVLVSVPAGAGTYTIKCSVQGFYN
jgi:hypothetical protein